MSTEFTSFNNSDLNDETKENTVEYKIINNYNKHINILNKIYYEQNNKYKQLKEFIKEYKLSKDSPIKSNITAPSGKYYIKPHIRTRFFEKLKDCCINENLTLHFREIQHSDFEKKEGSGLMYDFDLFQESKKNELHGKPFIDLFHIIIKIFIEVIDFKEPLNTYAAIITKKKLVYNEIKKKYKNGFHIIIPGIQLTKQAKILIYNKLLESQDLQYYFTEHFNCSLNTETFDKGCYSVPVYYLYNCKEDSNEPYELFNIYNIKYKNDLIVAQCNKDDIMNKYNIISELSLNHQGEMIDMIYYDLKDEYHQQLIFQQQSFNKFEDEKQRIEATFETERTDADENLDYYKTIVLEILDEKRADDRNAWRDVIYALANINPGAPHKYKPIAQLFSMRNQEKWDSNYFEKLWHEAINLNNGKKLTVASLMRWAIEDNKVKFNSLLSKDIVNTISHDVLYSENKVLNGTLYQFHYAYYIYHLFKHKFVCDISKKDTEWFEFVLDRDSHIKGQVYKWRNEKRPDNLYLYISNKLPEKINKVIEAAEEQVKKYPEKVEQNEYIVSRIQKLRSSAQKLYTTEFKKGIIREAEVLFRRRGFIQNLNTDQNIMGVGNGILELSNNPKLIKNYHDYPITLYTDIDYEPYDPKNPNTQLLINGIKNLFPNDEQDAFHYLMYYLASCLDGKPKDSMIFIITGSGSNGKSFMAELVKSILGNYGKKMPLSFLTDSRGKSSGADPALMELKTARLAYYSESNKHEVLNTAKLKEITSQETLSGRGLYEEQSQFRPVCHHMVTTNYHFAIKTTDHGIWRRIVTYEFKMLFTPNPNPDNKYEKKEDPKFAQEFTYNNEIKKSFLSVLVEYYKDLYTNHGGSLKNIMKPTIDKETANYRNKEDIINRFIDDVCIYSPGNKTCLSELVDKYEMWYECNVDKTGAPIKSEIEKQLENSKLTKFIEKTLTNRILKDIRIIEDTLDEDILSKDEKLLKDISENAKLAKVQYNLNRFNPLNL
jgi:P4 family phage/plasmid primase-like protien